MAHMVYVKMNASPEIAVGNQLMMQGYLGASMSRVSNDAGVPWCFHTKSE